MHKYFALKFQIDNILSEVPKANGSKMRDKATLYWIESVNQCCKGMNGM